MPTYDLRPYQREAIDRLVEGWRTAQNRLAVVLPTGAGKTVVFSALIRTVLPDIHGRALVIAHRAELIDQAAEKIRAVSPDLRVGIVKAELDQHRDADVIVASIQTLASKRRREAITDIGLIIVDECHHAAARSCATDAGIRAIPHIDRNAAVIRLAKRVTRNPRPHLGGGASRCPLPSPAPSCILKARP